MDRMIMNCDIEQYQQTTFNLKYILESNCTSECCIGTIHERQIAEYSCNIILLCQLNTDTQLSILIYQYINTQINNLKYCKTCYKECNVDTTFHNFPNILVLYKTNTTNFGGTVIEQIINLGTENYKLVGVGYFYNNNHFVARINHIDGICYDYDGMKNNGQYTQVGNSNDQNLFTFVLPDGKFAIIFYYVRLTS